MYISEASDYRGLVRSLDGHRAGRSQQGLGGLHGSFAGTLGTNSLPNEIEKLLDEVRKNPQNYRPLLLTIIFDPHSGYSSRMALSNALTRLNLGTPDAQAVLLSRPRLKQIVWQLDPIRANLQKRDARFQQLIDTELKLQSEMLKALGGIRPQRALEPFLLEAARISPAADLAFYWLGLDFAKKMLPAKLTQRLMSSSVSAGHLAYLGQVLRRLAEVLQDRSPAFKQRVEEERKIRK
jgi:hypothetical protein